MLKIPHVRPSHVIGVLAVACYSASAGAQPPRTPASEEPYVIEYYYKARWGFSDEFIRLFRKNHYPILKKEMEKGRILEVTGVAPRYHGTEDGRWDYRVTIVFRNAAAAAAPSGVTEADRRALFPDQASFEREEQRRFEILVAHWDLPVQTLRLTP